MMANTHPLDSALHLVVFASAQDFVQAVQPFDDEFMNFGLGMVMDTLSSSTSQGTEAEVLHEIAGSNAHPTEGTFAAVFKGQQLVLTMTHTTKRLPHFLSYPTTVSLSLLAPACALLTASLDLASIRQLGGPKEAIIALLNAAPSLRATAPTFAAIACSASLKTLSPPTSPSHGHGDEANTDYRYEICFARDEDALPLVVLALAFSAHSPWPSPSHVVLRILRDAIAARVLYAVRAYKHCGPTGDQTAAEQYDLAGYILLGRNTSRTLAIRNVFVATEHRRRGLAEIMVRSVTRACLGAPNPVTSEELESVQGTADVKVNVGAPGWGTKSVVCLLVSEPAVARIYARCGFVVDLDAKDPATGRSLCYGQELRGITMDA
ncbi:hypothetical protein DAEQUDRAFT_808892 [Daedalea quercina L-15889]|uniref:N-acetyltransferase domain-containing protein n=1 Tax=Daedalea quercina L-15889 TaxID=1314783 RepID=A0A165T4T5_9APHY|nr:hypothetical protein DAEQUDRAFT_808892 [Daedalea quercina L-15889]